MALAASALAFVSAAPAHAAPVDIQILATNDFHGRLVNESGAVAGAAILSGAVKQLEAENPNTHFVAAGDLIGASTFESFIQDDKPTIDALNAADLDVSAAGNHEFDKGYDDLVNRVMADYDPTTNPRGGAEWEYIAANLRKKSDGTHALAATWSEELAGVTVGYVGAVTEELEALVSPAGIADIDVTDIVEEVNASAAQLQADGADIVVMLVHEGAPGTSCETMDDSGAWADIINNISADVDAIVSGHTHLAYECSFPVEGLDHERPVVSAGQYGTNLNRLVFTVESDTGEITGVTTEILPLDGGETVYPPDPDVEEIVANAVEEADELGKQPLGEISGAFDRARWAEPDNDDEGDEPQITDSRGAESTLGNLVAEVQRWATEAEEFGGAEIAFMNPGGLRADLRGTDGTVTYKQAASVQPFANTLINMQLTGEQIKTVLEQQWQRDEDGEIPTRPFLRLGTSKGFEYSYDPSRPEGDRITGIWLNDVPLSKTESYSVTVNSFLASGGDNFRELANGANPRDTGQIDLQAMVDYMAANASEAPLDVDYAQHSVGATVTDTEIKLSSLSMTGETDVTDDTVEVFDGETSLGTAEVTTELMSTQFDEAGMATLPNTLPKDGKLHILRVVGEQTGTDIFVPVVAEQGRAASTMKLKVRPAKIVKKRHKVRVVVVVKTGGKAAAGKVVVKLGKKTRRANLKNGRAVVQLGKFAKPGKRVVRAAYLGNATTMPSLGTVKFRVRNK